MFLALERGTAFAAQAAVLSLACTLPALSFGITYAWSSRRLPWPGAVACAYVAWFGGVFALSLVPLNLWSALALALATLLAAPRFFPVPQPIGETRRLPAWEILLRMAAGAVMVLGVTAAAESLGTLWTGFFAAFPVMSTVMAVFSHRANGAGFTQAMLRAMVAGFYAYAAFCFVFGLAVVELGVAGATVAALLCLAGIQVVRAVAVRGRPGTATAR